ncbi:hypothetical protein ATCC90586_011687 [Pythium insidiosum]|nr:hypothetical protein ATCC90586_011687 [Pythium insidiosum]
MIEQLAKHPNVLSVEPEPILPPLKPMTSNTEPNVAAQPASAPHIVNNSWAGGKGLTIFNAAIDAWKAAGIIPIFAAGNAGPTCGSVLSPGDQPGVITVGATDSTDGLTSFSGKGPSLTGQVKPDVVAPGNLIRSTCFESDTAYCAMSGTSMATPHVSGAVALLLSAKPGMSFDAVKNAIQVSTTRRLKATGYTCCKTLDSVIPNNQFGFGLIDVVRALSV